jgi:hypothetical protein
VAALEEMCGWEKAAQGVLRMLADEKQSLERELNSARKTFVDRDTSSSKVMALTMAHMVDQLKSHVPDLDPELFREDYECESDAKRDALVDGVCMNNRLHIIVGCIALCLSAGIYRVQES